MLQKWEANRSKDGVYKDKMDKIRDNDHRRTADVFVIGVKESYSTWATVHFS